MHSLLNDALEIKNMRLGLERMERFDAALGHPSRAFQSIHIAGTNGKGSVATKIASALPGKVGLYTSPHIESYRERIKINGEMIKNPDPLLHHIVDTIDEKPTYFELLTLLAFVYFAEQKVDYAVLEVGMGGRLDATNIVTPLISVITSIGLDHTEFLGDTLDKIAAEKGGIIKPGVPLVVGPTAHYYEDAHLVPGPFAHYEEENNAIATRALELLGMESPTLSDAPPCRFERIGPFILDGAHNPAAFRRLHERLRGEKVRLLVAFSKDPTECLKEIEAPYHFVHVDHPRLVNHPEAISIEEGLALRQPDETLVICGSFFMMEAARATIEKALLDE